MRRFNDLDRSVTAVQAVFTPRALFNHSRYVYINLFPEVNYGGGSFVQLFILFVKLMSPPFAKGRISVCMRVSLG